MSYYRRSRWGYPTYEKKTIVKDPALGARIDKVMGESDLNIRTRDFLANLSDFYKKNSGLTEKQLSSFEKIESRFSPQEKLALQKWTETYQQEHLEDAEILAVYYAQTGYFTEMASQILASPNYVPDRSRFLKMKNNKYAQRVLELHNVTPRFQERELIQIRSSVGTATSTIRKLRNRLCFVLSNKLPICNAVAGGKRYAILPIGSSQPVEADERWMMKPNKNGVKQ